MLGIIGQTKRSFFEECQFQSSDVSSSRKCFLSYSLDGRKFWRFASKKYFFYGKNGNFSKKVPYFPLFFPFSPKLPISHLAEQCENGDPLGGKDWRLPVPLSSNYSLSNKRAKIFFFFNPTHCGISACHIPKNMCSQG